MRGLCWSNLLQWVKQSRKNHNLDIVHQIELKFFVCFILTILLQPYEMSRSKKLIVSWFFKNWQLTLVLGFRGSWVSAGKWPFPALCLCGQKVYLHLGVWKGVGNTWLDLTNCASAYFCLHFSSNRNNTTWSSASAIYSHLPLERLFIPEIRKIIDGTGGQFVL
jgi:hypothetical protein